jgi:hypothetical protein
VLDINCSYAVIRSLFKLDHFCLAQILPSLIRYFYQGLTLKSPDGTASAYSLVDSVLMCFTVIDAIRQTTTEMDVEHPSHRKRGEK